MKNKDPVFWAASRLHRLLSQLCETCDDLASRTTAVIANLAAMERLRLMLAMAQSRGWPAAANSLRARLLAQAERVQSDCSELRRERRRHPLPPSLADLMADLRQLHDEFEQVEVQPREGRICAATDAITLEGVPLGMFSIQLCLARFATHLDASAFEIIAEDPNPASGSSDTSHPHVSGASLCAGDATVPIAAALAEGRIADAFCLVSAVLHTYNPASAYVQLSDWEGVTCSDCGRSSHADEVYYCDGCGSEYCESCISSCERCDRSLCLSCLEEDDDGDRICRHCQRICRQCDRTGDAARLRRQHGLCDDCLAKEESDASDGGHHDNGIVPVSAVPTNDPDQPTTEHCHEPIPEERAEAEPGRHPACPDGIAPSGGEADGTPSGAVGYGPQSHLTAVALESAAVVAARV